MTAEARGKPALTFTPPCLASAVPVPPDGDEWLHEIKLDGYRIQAIVEHGSARILTRTGLDWTARFSGLTRALSQLDVASAVIDGEAVVRDPAGITRFSMLQSALKRDDGAITLMAFDVLHLDGRDVSVLPLTERKRLLTERLARRGVDRARVHYVDHMVGYGSKLLAKACAMGLEGIISKRVDRPYRPGRRGDWTKAKCVRSDPFVVVGYTKQKNNPAIIGALVVAFYDNDELIYAGRVGTGFTMAEAGAMASGLAAIRTRPKAFVGRLDRLQKAGVTWVEPRLVAQIAWRDVTEDGMLRHASFEHFREDKPAREIRRPPAFQIAADKI